MTPQRSRTAQAPADSRRACFVGSALRVGWPGGRGERVPAGLARVACCSTVSYPSLAAQIQATCRLTGEFVLRSGRTSDEYFDKYQFEADPELLDTVARQLADLVPPEVEVLAGLEMGGIAVVTALGRHSGLPCAFVRKAPKQYGTRRLAEGAELAGRQTLVVEDVVTSGGQIAISTRQLREAGARIDHALCVIDRREGGAEALAAEGILLRSLLDRGDLEAAAGPDHRS